MIIYTIINWLDSLVAAAGAFAWGPVTIILLLGTGLYYTILLKGLQFRSFKHALQLISGKYDDPSHKGEVSHFQALSAALSATIGTGNIAGVATAIAAGGPGAVFWMWMVAVVGMLLKYSESVLAQKFRVIGEDGVVSGGPMYYLDKGLKQKWLGTLFALFTVIASFGIGNMVQANSAAEPMSAIILGEVSGSSFVAVKLIIGIVLAFLTGSVIIGGIKRIGSFAAKIVPFMCLVYITGSMFILLKNFNSLGDSFNLIITYAFTPAAPVGGFLGATVAQAVRFGVARALFSSEAGLGSSPIAHSAARTNEPVREGLVAMMEPFIDTLLVCSMTALVIITSGLWTEGLTSSPLTMAAFENQLPGIGGYIVSLGLILFAFSTLVSWSYYGDRASEYLWGAKAVPIYRWVYVLIIPIGAALQVHWVWDISDVFNALMAFPNLIGLLGLSGVVVAATADYFNRKPQLDEENKRRKQ